MNNNINLLAFGTFGNPNGFRQTIFNIGKPLKQDVKTFDLNTNAIKLFPNSKMYAIRKENLNGLNAISYSIYTFAKEQNSARGGTFIGSSILYANEIANESLTLNVLNDFNNTLISKHVINEIIQVNHSDNFSVSKPKDFDKLSYNQKKIEEVNFNQFSNRHLVVHTEIKLETVAGLLQKSIDLLNLYDTIYFTNSNEIAEFVLHKRLYKFVDVNGFNQEIETIENEKKQKILNAIIEFEREKQIVLADRERVITELRNQHIQNEKTHLENQKILNETQPNIDKLNSFYSQFEQKINYFLSQLNTGSKLETVKEKYNEDKNSFITSIAEIKQPQYVKNIQKPKPNSNLRVEKKAILEPIVYQDYDRSNDNEKVHRRRRSGNSKMILLLLLLGVIAIILFLIFEFYKSYSNQNETEANQTVQQQTLVIEPIKQEQPKLNPLPNNQLNDNDLKLITKGGIKNKSATEIVEIIFTKNPTDIASIYSNQKQLYEQELISKNNSCFKNNTCINDSIKYVPTFKKQ